MTSTSTSLALRFGTDQKMDNGFRWLTVGPKGQPGSDGRRRFSNGRLPAYLRRVESERRGVHAAAYGIEALMKDNSGNWFSMTQPREAYETPA